LSTNKIISHLNSAVAFTKMPNGNCRAVKIEQTPAGVKLLWKHTGGAADLNDAMASAHVSLSKTHTVLGIDPPGVAFYNIEIPLVPDAQLDSIVRMQAETILPLPLSQMEIAYHCGRVVADKCYVTIAAGRSVQLNAEMGFAKECKASGIVLSSQGTVKAFDTLFNAPQQKYIILNMRKNDTQVLLSEDSKLVHAARLDIGIDDLSNADPQAGEMFIYDLRNTLDMFGLDISGDTAMYVFSESEQLTEKVVAGLNEVQIFAQAAELKPHAIISESPLSGEDICEYLDTIGSALLSLDEDNPPLNLFSELYNLKKKKKKATGLVPLIRAAVIFAIMLVATFFTLNHLNKLELAKYDNDEIDKLVSLQNTRRLIAGQRPDILKMLTLINKDAPSGMTVDSISFKKGEKSIIASHAKNYDQIIKMQNFLSSKKDFTEVKIQNPNFDEKTKKYSFKINFHYKKWNRKSAR
jgi:hypothetical protein